MILNLVLVVAMVGACAWWLVYAVAEVRDPDSGRNEQLNLEAAVVLLLTGVAGLLLSGQLGWTMAGGAAILAGLTLGFVGRRRARR